MKEQKTNVQLHRLFGRFLPEAEADWPFNDDGVPCEAVTEDELDEIKVRGFDDHPALDHLEFFPRPAVVPLIIGVLVLGAVVPIIILFGFSLAQDRPNLASFILLSPVLLLSVAALIFGFFNAEAILRLRAKYMWRRIVELKRFAYIVSAEKVEVPKDWEGLHDELEGVDKNYLAGVEPSGTKWSRFWRAMDVFHFFHAKSTVSERRESSKLKAFLQREYIDTVDTSPAIFGSSLVAGLLVVAYVLLTLWAFLQSGLIAFEPDAWIVPGVSIVAITAASLWSGIYFAGATTRFVASTRVPSRERRNWWRIGRAWVVFWTPWLRSESASELLRRLPRKDRNDIEIVELKASLQRDVERVQNFTIESTLFAGISLASFLAIVSSDEYDDQIEPYVREIAHQFAMRAQGVGENTPADALVEESERLAPSVTPISELTEPLRRWVGELTSPIWAFAERAVVDITLSLKLLWEYSLGSFGSEIQLSDSVMVAVLGTNPDFGQGPTLLFPLAVLLLFATVLFVCILLLRLPFALALGKTIQRLVAAQRMDEKEEDAWRENKKGRLSRGIPGEAGANVSANLWSLLNEGYYLKYRTYIRRAITQARSAKVRINLFRIAMDVLRLTGFFVVGLALIVAGGYFHTSVAWAIGGFFLAFLIFTASREALHLGETFDDPLTERALEEGFAGGAHEASDAEKHVAGVSSGRTGDPSQSSP